MHWICLRQTTHNLSVNFVSNTGSLRPPQQPHILCKIWPGLCRQCASDNICVTHTLFGLLNKCELCGTYPTHNDNQDTLQICRGNNRCIPGVSLGHIMLRFRVHFSSHIIHTLGALVCRVYAINIASLILGPWSHQIRQTYEKESATFLPVTEVYSSPDYTNLFAVRCTHSIPDEYHMTCRTPRGHTVEQYASPPHCCFLPYPSQYIV